MLQALLASFNSNLVRFKVDEIINSTKGVPMFQFQFGAI